MKKFILASVFVVAASSMIADDAAVAPAAPVAPATAESKNSKESNSWFSMPSISCPACVKNAQASVEAQMIAHPWYSAAAVAVSTVLVVKVLEYALTSEDEEAGF